MTDVVETQKASSSHGEAGGVVLQQRHQAAQLYLVPIKRRPRRSTSGADLVEKAGFKMADAPKTWDAFWDFFKPMQKKLREKGMRKRVRAWRALTTVGADRRQQPVLPLPDRQRRPRASSRRTASCIATIRRSSEAVIKSVTYLTTSYKEGYVPAEALSWSDADDNNGFHAEAVRHGFRRHNLDRVRDVSTTRRRITKSRHDGACRMATTASRCRPDSAPAAAISRRARRISRWPRTS